MLDSSSRPLLMLSGGRDSLACYYLLRPYWDKLLVVFINTGDAFAETLDIINNVKESHELFLEVSSDVKGFKATAGDCFDIIHADQTVHGILSGGDGGNKACSRFDCCNANLWQPNARIMSELKPDLVIRGERRSESLKSPILDGHIENGVTYHLPIYEWSDKEVLDFLEKEMGELPFHFFFNESSLDCMGCTAYSAHTSDRIEWMKENYPEQYAINKEKQEKQKRYLLDKLKDF